MHVLTRQSANAIWVILALILSACATGPGDTGSDAQTPPKAIHYFKTTARFDLHTSFDWVAPNPLYGLSLTDPPDQSRSFNRSIRAAVGRSMRLKGYEDWSETSRPDLIFSYSLGNRDRLSAWESARYPNAKGWSGTLITQSYPQGTLSIDVFDGRSGNLIWHGLHLRARVGPSTSPETLAAIVRETLRDFPPRPFKAPRDREPDQQPDPSAKPIEVAS